jgi:hypothetical protein
MKSLRTQGQDSLSEGSCCDENTEFLGTRASGPQPWSMSFDVAGQRPAHPGKAKFSYIPKED